MLVGGVGVVVVIVVLVVVLSWSSSKGSSADGIATAAEDSTIETSIEYVLTY